MSELNGRCCSICGQFKPFEDFYVYKKSGKRYPRCKPCCTEYKKQWRKKNPKRNLRTRKGREAEVISKILVDGGFRVFWATENQLRAAAIDRLEAEGRIVRNGGTFPWCKYEVR